MERRSFLKAFTGAVAVAATGLWNYEMDLDRALWVPGKKTIFDLGENLALPDEFLLNITPAMLYEFAGGRDPATFKRFVDMHTQYWDGSTQMWHNVPLTPATEETRIRAVSAFKKPSEWRIVLK